MEAFGQSGLRVHTRREESTRRQTSCPMHMNQNQWQDVVDFGRLPEARQGLGMPMPMQPHAEQDVFGHPMQLLPLLESAVHKLQADLRNAREQLQADSYRPSPVRVSQGPKSVFADAAYSPFSVSSPRKHSAACSRQSSYSKLPLLSRTTSQELSSPVSPDPPQKRASMSRFFSQELQSSSCSSSHSYTHEEVYSPGQSRSVFARISEYCAVDINLTLEIAQRYKARMEMPSPSSSSSPCSTCPSSPSSARSTSSHGSHAFSFDLMAAVAGLTRRHRGMAAHCLKLTSLLLRNPFLARSSAFDTKSIKIATGCVAPDLLRLARSAGLTLHSHWQAVAIGQAVRHALLSRGVPQDLAQEAVTLVKAVVDELITVRRTV